MPRVRTQPRGTTQTYQQIIQKKLGHLLRSMQLEPISETISEDQVTSISAAYSEDCSELSSQMSMKSMDYFASNQTSDFDLCQHLNRPVMKAKKNKSEVFSSSSLIQNPS